MYTKWVMAKADTTLLAGLHKMTIYILNNTYRNDLALLFETLEIH
jgi:hypothetical protein